MYTHSLYLYIYTDIHTMTLYTPDLPQLCFKITHHRGVPGSNNRHRARSNVSRAGAELRGDWEKKHDVCFGCILLPNPGIKVYNNDFHGFTIFFKDVLQCTTSD